MMSQLLRTDNVLAHRWCLKSRAECSRVSTSNACSRHQQWHAHILWANITCTSCTYWPTADTGLQLCASNLHAQHVHEPEDHLIQS